MKNINKEERKTRLEILILSTKFKFVTDRVRMSSQEGYFYRLN